MACLTSDAGSKKLNRTSLDTASILLEKTVAWNSRFVFDRKFTKAGANLYGSVPPPTMTILGDTFGFDSDTAPNSRIDFLTLMNSGPIKY